MKLTYMFSPKNIITSFKNYTIYDEIKDFQKFYC